jgi:uncharacterized membrane protein
MENRAYLMTVAMQRWLAIRLDFFGNILILGIALFGAASSKTINPAKTGVVLSYTLGSEWQDCLHVGQGLRNCFVAVTMTFGMSVPKDMNGRLITNMGFQPKLFLFLPTANRR